MRSSLSSSVVCALALAAVAVLASCEACAPVEETPASSRCKAADGTELSVGQSIPLPDGCNTCICNASIELICSNRDCDPAPPGEGEGDGGEGEGVEGEGEEGEGEDTSDLGPCPDEDNDGYHPCVDANFPDRAPELDCDDRRFHVQPNGYEFPDTPEDDNCDGSNNDALTCACGSASQANDLAGAMDLCGVEIVSATKSGNAMQFGIVDAYRNVIDERLRTRVDDPQLPPTIIGNSCLMTISSGDAVGTAEDQDFSCFFQDPDPAAPDQTDEICDVAQLRLTLAVPPNVQGFAFDFMFLSMEWPEYLCLSFNDTFYSIVRTPAVNGGLATNAAFDTQNRPITVNVGFFENPEAWTVPLDGTPHGAVVSDSCPSGGLAPGCTLPEYCGDDDLDVRAGSGSGWLTTSVPVIPGQQDLQLTLSIHDEGDGILDSIALVDAFRWLPFEPELTTSKDGR